MSPECEFQDSINKCGGHSHRLAVRRDKRMRPINRLSRLASRRFPTTRPSLSKSRFRLRCVWRGRAQIDISHMWKSQILNFDFILLITLYPKSKTNFK
ncbi:hypothetical protein CDAR_261131 [Caerostris darwini]|uniref:Uncharacterized protein n=1 Tax=Caerostris darwini TaxID=1538125 RepID=A0AAV4NRH5_9ARAC|nr:hypothetical protein CDAR_261131 [Caerostris darwini]